MIKDDLAAVFERVKTWPEDRQAEAIEMLLAIEAAEPGPMTLSESERAGVERGLNDLRNRRFASDEDMAAFFARHKS